MLQMFINSLLSAEWTKQRNGYRHRDFDTRAGTVISSIHRRHRSIEFKKFLAKIDVKVPDELEVHLVCDNHSTHKSPTITKWIQAHPGSTCTSHRPTRRGSTRSNDSLPTSPLIFSNAQTTAVFKRSKQTFAHGSKGGTRTPSHSSGPSPPNRTSNPSNDFYNELPAQDTSGHLDATAIERQPKTDLHLREPSMKFGGGLAFNKTARGIERGVP